MATTTNFGWETPDDTDLVKDGALAIRTLGSAIDTSLVDLKGGTTGQVLSKASNTDMDFSWVAVDPLTILDAKGDLISATAADTPARLAVGTNGQVLTADSATSTGLKWATPSSGSTVKVNYVNPSADFTSSSASTVDITGYSITFTPTSATNKIVISYNLTGIRSTSDAPRLVVDINGTTESLRGNYINTTYEFAYSGLFVMTNMAASSTTVKLRINPAGTSTTFYGAGAGFKGQNLTVMEIY